MAITIEEERAVAPADRPMYYNPREVHYLDVDVLTAAKQRIRQCILGYDRVVVSYSGGKDSEVVLRLTRDVMDDMGMAAVPLEVMFRDEELIPQDVIDHVLRLRDQPDRYKLYVLAFPQKSHYFIMGQHYPYVQWDEARRDNWVRQKPVDSIEQVHPTNEPLHQTEINIWVNQALGWRGRICLLNGIRTEESRHRFMSCIAVKNAQNYVAKDSGGAKGCDFVKPIFDWTEKDVFRYFFDTGYEYCSIYDLYMHAAAPLRVATPVHDNGFEQLRKLRQTYPRFYEAIVAIWPDIDAQTRYWEDFNSSAVISRYPVGWKGIFQYIDEAIAPRNPAAAEVARESVRTARRAKETNRKRGRHIDACFGYPILYVFEKVVMGKFQRGITSKNSASQAWIDYERLAEAEAAG